MDGIKVKIAWDEVDNIVMSQLEVMISDLLADPWAFAHNYADTLKSVDAALLTLQHFMSDQMYQGYFKTIEGSYNQLVSLAEPLNIEDFV